MIKFLIFFVIICLNGAFSEDDKYYFSYPLKTNWFKAIEACKFRNMELISVPTPDALIDIQTYIDDLKFDTKFDSWSNSIWTSGNDLGEQRQHTWMSSGKHISQDFLKKHNKYIDNYDHRNCKIEHCLALVRKPANLFTFNDDVCTSQRYFLCEKVFAECDFSIFERFDEVTTQKPITTNSN